MLQYTTLFQSQVRFRKKLFMLNWDELLFIDKHQEIVYTSNVIIVWLSSAL